MERLASSDVRPSAGPDDPAVGDHGAPARRPPAGRARRSPARCRRRTTSGARSVPANEDQTPPELLRDPSGPDWRVRVVPNMYSALGDEGRPAAAPARRSSARCRASGSHEVVIESAASRRAHGRDDARRGVRGRPVVADPVPRSCWSGPRSGPRWCSRTSGESAGASLTHPHSQIVGLADLPAPAAAPPRRRHPLLRRERLLRLRRRRGRGARGRPPDGGRARAGSPPSRPSRARSPFETWIVPTVHGSSLGNLSDDDMPALAETLIRVLGAIRRRRAAIPDYNFVVYSTESEGRRERRLLLAHQDHPEAVHARRVRAELGHEHQHRGARGRGARAAARRSPPSLSRSLSFRSTDVVSCRVIAPTRRDPLRATTPSDRPRRNVCSRS